MIKIYTEKELEKKFIELLKNDDEIWDFSIDELDYLLEEHKDCSFVLVDNRLYEWSDENE